MKKILLLVAFSFAFNSSYSIIYWQAYPITATIGTLGSQHRLECSVFDSLLGSWQYYNTPYFNSGVDTSGGGSTIIVFATYHPPSIYNLDTTYGFVTYDQELHQFMPIIQYHHDPDYPGGYVNAFDGVVSVFTECCLDNWNGNTFQDVEGYIYDIKTHTWTGGILGSENYAGYIIKKGGFIMSYTDDESYNPLQRLDYFDPVLHNFRTDYLGPVTLAYGIFGGNQDLYYSFHDAMLADDGADFSAYDSRFHGWNVWSNEHADLNNKLFNNGIFYTRNVTTGVNYFGVYDDSLHKWTVDSTNLAISNVLIKNHVVAYKYSNKVYYMAFSPTLRTWVKDSSTVTTGIDSLYIQNGTVKWRNTLGVTKKAGYNNATGWGNFNTPLLLNFHLTDFYSSTGTPLIFVRNYSIGTDSVMYDFGDGITSDWNQNSLWHQYKVNGHYASGGPNYSVCIKAPSSSGIQSSCQAVTQPCSATFNISSNCTGLCNGHIAAITQTGQAPFSFLWSTGATSSSIHSLCTGSYTVTITDNSGCSITSNSVISPLTVTASPTSTICSGSCNGSAGVNVSGGTVPYTYLWSTGNTTGSISNLCIGSYSVIVTDRHNCSKSAGSDVINPIILPTISSDIYTQPSCLTCNDGEIDYEIGGIPPITFSWSPNIGTINTNYSPYFLWSNLPTGIYTLTDTDGFGCSVSITDTLLPLIAAITPNGPTTFCNGDSVVLSVPSQANCLYQWRKYFSNISGATSSSYTATVAGYYQVLVTNTSTGCSQLTSPGTFVTINTQPSALITPQGSTTFCSGDSVILTVPFHSNCTYQWKKNNVNIPGATSSSYTATTGGIYKVKVTSSVTGCSKLTGAAVTVTVQQQPTATITANGPTTFCVGDSVLLTANSGTGYTYQWKKYGANIAGATYQNYNAKTAGSYKVRVSVTSCAADISPPIIVTVPCGPIIDPNQKTGDDNSEESNPELVVSYNPLVQTALIDARHLKGKNYTLHVYDIIGKEVYKEEGAVAYSGTESFYKKELNLFMYSKGIYAVNLQTEYDRLVKKFVKD